MLLLFVHPVSLGLGTPQQETRWHPVFPTAPNLFLYLYQNQQWEETTKFKNEGLLWVLIVCECAQRGQTRLLG